MKIYSSLTGKIRNGQKCFAVLVDPDKYSASGIKNLAIVAEKTGVDFIFYGGSLLIKDNHRKYLALLKEKCSVPLVLFPGSHMQLSGEADGILLLSLISGRNPDMLIGKHVVAAPFLKASRLEILPTGYMLIESGRSTAVSYMSSTTPIPADKDDIAVCTAMAGEMLGLKLIYMDAGSGASKPVSINMIKKVKQHISIPLIVGGGIRNALQAKEMCLAGADVIVVGNAIEKDISLIKDIAASVQKIREIH